jgi:hypothetical protein
LFAIGFSPEDMRGGSDMNRKLRNGDTGFLKSSMKWDILSMAHNEVIYPLKALANQLSLISTIKLNDMLKLLEGLEERAVKTKWITAEIDRITALIYFMATISLFIVAIIILPSILHKFAQVFVDIELVRLGVLIFSVLALSAVGYMLILRMRGLLDKASTVFKYLTALGAIKSDREKFKGNLQDVEGYLNSGDWTLAKYWVIRIQQEYTVVFLNEVSKAEPSKDNSDDRNKIE